MKKHILKTILVLLPVLALAPVRAQMGNDNSAPSATGANAGDQNTANTNGQGTDTGNGGVSHGDRMFAEKLAMGSTNEVALGQLADSHASSNDVKEFGQMMVTDHTKLNQQLQDLAQRKGVDISDSVQKGQKKGVSRLEKKNGADFDKAYIKEMVRSHEETLKLLKKEASDAKDPDFAQFATSAIPTVQQHLDRAKELEKNLNQ